MTQRNPMNERYQRDEHTGKTRKSAASAKPVTKAASSVRIENNKPAPSRGLFSRSSSSSADQQKRQQEREARLKYYNPDTPEYKRWRRIWWITIVVALSLTALSFVVQIAIPDATVGSYVLLGIGYAALIFAIWIDMGKVRKMRRAYAQQMMGGKSKAATKARKAEKAQAQREAEQARKRGEEEAARQAAQKAERKGIFGRFGKKAKSAKAAAPSEEVTAEKK